MTPTTNGLSAFSDKEEEGDEKSDKEESVGDHASLVWFWKQARDKSKYRWQKEVDKLVTNGVPVSSTGFKEK